MNARAKDLATQYLFENMELITPAARPFFLARCAAWLNREHLVTQERAAKVSVQALGELESKQCPFVIDIDNSTSFSLVITNRITKEKQAFTIGQLFEQLQREAPGAAATPTA